MKLKTALLGAVLSAVSVAAAAADIKGEWSTGFEFGGDNLVSLPLLGGDTATINAGDGFYLKAGASMPLSDTQPLELVATLGWKYTGVQVSTLGGSTGSIDFTRFPLDVAVRYTIDKHRFNAGFVDDLSISFSCSGVLSCSNTSMKSKLGYTLQYEYIFNKNINFGARYTSLEYDMTDLGVTADASSFGILMSGSF